MKAEELFARVSNISEEKRAALINHARLFLTSDKYRPQFDEIEKNVLRPFFTNINDRVFFIHSLPENIIAVLMAMYSRLKNKRGLRGVFVDTFLPHFLASDFSEVANQFGGKVDVFLNQHGLYSLRAFITYSEKSLRAYDDFIRSFNIDPDYIKKFANSPKIKSFLNMWLDKFGHNSIARPAKITLCAENVSILAAKSFEWTRPGSGYIELSTRYVDMSGKDLYPIEKEIAEFGMPKDAVSCVMNLAFRYYRDYQGENFTGPFPRFLRDQYGKIVKDERDLENGVIGETCDVLGNFLPCATLTSLGISASGEAFSQLLKHLILDGTPENLVLVEMILEEAAKIGGDQFARHFEPTEWEKSSWKYLNAAGFGYYDYLKSSEISQALLIPDQIASFILKESFSKQYNIRRSESFADFVKKNLYSPGRNDKSHDKLPNHFEGVSAVFSGIMSFRSWRDLQRQQLATHYRTYVTPELGFYRYDKPAPQWLFEACKNISRKDLKLFLEMKKFGVFPELMQYPMSMGNMVGFQIGGNLLEMEFCNWQRTKFGVNHEVRQIFLGIEKALREEYSWWENISRANMTPAFVFARTREGIPLV